MWAHRNLQEKNRTTLPGIPQPPETNREDWVRKGTFAIAELHQTRVAQGLWVAFRRTLTNRINAISLCRVDSDAGHCKRDGTILQADLYVRG